MDLLYRKLSHRKSKVYVYVIKKVMCRQILIRCKIDRRNIRYDKINKPWEEDIHLETEREDVKGLPIYCQRI